MKIGVCRYVNDGNSFNMSEGMLNAITRMGHTYVDAVLEKNEWPTDDWNSLDLLLILEADHYDRPEKWEWVKIPKALWYTETARRVDLHFEERYERHKALTPHRFFVAKQDAEFYGGTWLPHGVDLEMYRPLGIPKAHDIGFFGHIYEKRIPFWRQIIDSGFEVAIINRDPGTREQQFEGLARDINSCNIILALPAYSHSFTTRPLECMACGVPIVVPRLADFARCNEAQWEIPPCLYDEGNMDSLRAAIQEARTRTVQELVQEASRHSVEKKLEIILNQVFPR